jgi:hypothetical protein
VNNRQAALVAASTAGLEGPDLERRVRILELWLDELDRAQAGKRAPLPLTVIETAMERADELLRFGHGVVVRIVQNEGNPVVELSDGETYVWTSDRWYSRGPIQVAS